MSVLCSDCYCLLLFAAVCCRCAHAENCGAPVTCSRTPLATVVASISSFLNTAVSSLAAWKCRPPGAAWKACRFAYFLKIAHSTAVLDRIKHISNFMLFCLLFFFFANFLYPWEILFENPTKKNDTNVAIINNENETKKIKTYNNNNSILIKKTITQPSQLMTQIIQKPTQTNS